MHARSTALALFLIASAVAPTVRAEDVRVILPFQPDRGSSAPLERVEPEDDARRLETGDVCDLIASSAGQHGLPPSFFARLIWQESRFDAGAVSPAGAQGIAQFMPATALRRGLRNAFDPLQAIPASAAYLADLRREFGNLGLAAAAYNAGEERVSRWLARGGYLPFETENYVRTILGKPVEAFREIDRDEPQQPLAEGKPFAAACRALPVRRTTGISVASEARPAWGAQVAGHFDRAVAMRKWDRLKSRHPSILDGREPAVFAARSPLGRKRLHVVQIGAADRREASDLCNRLRLAGGSCVVVRN